MLSIEELSLADKRVLIREDLNVPLQDGNITSDVRIRAALPTIKLAVAAGAKVILISHLGRPQEGQYEEKFSLAPVAKRLSQFLDQPVPLVKNWLGGIELEAGQVVLCENVRFNCGEKKNEVTLAKKMASLCDIFVMDAFATAHRTEASTVGVAQFAPTAVAGLLLMKEITAINQALKTPQHPVVAIVAGSKISTKLKVLDALLDKVDVLIVGGGIANTLIAASGHNVAASLYEKNFLDEAQRLLKKAQKLGKKIPLPQDVVVASELSETASARTCSITTVSGDDKILDIGPQSCQQLTKLLLQAGTILWNGPVGVFELTPFSHGTQAIAKAVANSKAFSIAGGGDTLAAIEKYNVSGKISYISTGGGAFLTCLQGEPLPAITILEQRTTEKRTESYEQTK